MALFSLGQVVASQGAVHQLTEVELAAVLRRHAAGDWGDVCAEQRKKNDRSLQCGQPIFSVYTLGPGRVVLVQTDGERTSSFVQIQDEEASSQNRFTRLFLQKFFEKYVAGDFLTVIGQSIWRLAKRHTARNKKPL